MPDLDGLTIVVTRPAHQAENLCQMIEAEGGSPLRFPVIDIRPPADPTALAAILRQLDHYQMAVFVSANAVDFAYAALDTGSGLPQQLQRVAVGQATAKAMAKHGQPAQLIPPEPYNSEALLAMPQLQTVAGKRIIIFRGEGGREHLAESLKQRGAQVDYAECYQRLTPTTDPAPLTAAWKAHKLHAIAVTSNEALHNLVTLVGGSQWQELAATPLVVISQRAAALAREMGFEVAATVAEAASDEALLAAIKRVARNRRDG
jgi:uroporphyrinogen-III synthase